MARRNRLVARKGFIVALIALAAACGGTEPLSADDQALADAIETEIAAAADGSNDPETHRCYAEGAVIALGGADEIERRFGVTAADVLAGTSLQDFGLSRDDAVDVADALIECVDQPRLLSIDSGITYAQAECLLEEVPQGLGLNLSVAAGLIGDGADELIAEYQAHLDSIGDDLLEARGQCFN